MNMDNDREIRKANLKALPKFILIMVVSMALGGVVGYLAARYGLDSLSGSLKAAGDVFGIQVAPWLMLAVAVIVPVVSIPLYRRAKKLLGAWDGEDESVSDAIDGLLSIVIWITGAALIVSYFLIAASYSGGFAMFDKENTVPFFVSMAAFIGIMIEAVLIQQRCVDAAKKTNPEKTASVYDVNFHKKWMDSCDEAEKVVIGKCAFKAYCATNTVCTTLAIVLAISALIFGIGFLPSLVVCAVWIVNLTVYCMEALKYGKAGNKIV